MLHNCLSVKCTPCSPGGEGRNQSFLLDFFLLIMRLCKVPHSKAGRERFKQEISCEFEGSRGMIYKNPIQWGSLHPENALRGPSFSCFRIQLIGHRSNYPTLLLKTSPSLTEIWLCEAQIS
ncbi:hypothetical protein D5086_025389 [Populus alba]|uniref:Uncharacterized protein n=1 Tax=Populus alba TaxID=43335 RepID=A0ACC4AZB6_POPAL